MFWTHVYRNQFPSQAQSDWVRALFVGGLNVLVPSCNLYQFIAIYNNFSNCYSGAPSRGTPWPSEGSSRLSRICKKYLKKYIPKECAKNISKYIQDISKTSKINTQYQAARLGPSSAAWYFAFILEILDIS